MATATSVEFAGQLLKLPVYLDYQATTPVDPRVLDAMLPYFHERHGNPHSVHHPYGWEARDAVERARAQVASLIGARPENVVFTSGATEAANLALRGAVGSAPPGKRHIITCATEHACVLETIESLQEQGAPVTVLSVGDDGLVDPERVAGAVRSDTLLVSIMAANNEIGVVQPLQQIGELCAERGVLLHTDAAQAAGKIPLDVDALHLDLLSLSGHKMYAPMGVGALYVRREPRVRLTPMITGGGQERGLRAGTLPAPLCVGLGAACEIAAAEMQAEEERLRALRDRLWSALSERLTDIHLHGDPVQRVAGNLNVGIEGIDAEELILEARELALSTASACTSATLRPSHVLRALGVSEELAHGSVRIGIGRFTTAAEVDFAVERLVAVVEQLRGVTPPSP